MIFSKKILSKYRNWNFRNEYQDSINYWKQRYSNGGTSGEGAVKELAQFKSTIINDFIKEKKIQTIIEFGCGEGKFLKNLKFNKYIGLDVSDIAIQKCEEAFRGNSNLSFFLYNPASFFNNSKIFLCDLAISLDVIYLIPEDKIFYKYMFDLFNAARSFVVIFSTDFDEEQNGYLKNRNFSKWVSENIYDWKLVNVIHQKHSEVLTNSNLCSFYFYER